MRWIQFEVKKQEVIIEIEMDSNNTVKCVNSYLVNNIDQYYGI